MEDDNCSTCIPWVFCDKYREPFFRLEGIVATSWDNLVDSLHWRSSILGWEAINKEEERTIKEEPSTLVPWESKRSPSHVSFLKIFSKQCSGGLTYRSTQVGKFVPTAKPKRNGFLGTDVANSLHLGGGVTTGACFDLLWKFPLRIGPVSFSSMGIFRMSYSAIWEQVCSRWGEMQGHPFFRFYFFFFGVNGTEIGGRENLRRN